MSFGKKHLPKVLILESTELTTQEIETRLQMAGTDLQALQCGCLYHYPPAGTVRRRVQMVYRCPKHA